MTLNKIYEASRMKKCGRCGKENGDEDNYCRDCGAPLNAYQTAIHKNESLLERFGKANILVKLMIIASAVIIMLLIIGVTSYIFFGMPLDSYSEEAESKNLVDFNAIDMDCDGALT